MYSVRSRVVFTSIASCSPSLSLPASISGRGICVAPPEAGALNAANPWSQRSRTRSLSSFAPPIIPPQSLALDVYQSTFISTFIRLLRLGFGPARVATAILKDETGQVKLNLWRDQIERAKVGETVRLENAFAREFRGWTELSIGSDGSITVQRRS